MSDGRGSESGFEVEPTLPSVAPVESAPRGHATPRPQRLRSVDPRRIDEYGERLDGLESEIYGECDHDGMRVEMQRLRGELDAARSDASYAREDRRRENDENARRYDQMFELAKTYATRGVDPVIRVCAVALTIVAIVQMLHVAE